jgi:hypothetical protein
MLNLTISPITGTKQHMLDLAQWQVFQGAGA